MKIIVTGAAGFIGSNLVNYLVHDLQHHVLSIDKLTYAGHLENIREVINEHQHHFVKADICDHQAMLEIIEDFAPDLLFHLAAESHVDRSIDSPFVFINTNVLGTEVLLNASLKYWQKNPNFKFIQISTDEVYGSLGTTGKFTENSPYAPNSPYAASKAAAEMLAKAYYQTYGLPVMVANCSNNYGPKQYPEKLIPLTILKALQQQPLPVYGDGQQIRDWLYVTDHIQALWKIATIGSIGASYAIGGNNEITNLTVVQTICDYLDQIKPRNKAKSYRDLINFVTDRPGHDRRYAIDPSKMARELNWQARTNFSQGITETINWYLNNKNWLHTVTKNSTVTNRLGLQLIGQ